MKNLLLVVLVLSLPSPVRAAPALVDFALNGFLESFEKIRTFHFRYEVTASADGQPNSLTLVQAVQSP
jgi:hypothetical protein